MKTNHSDKNNSAYLKKHFKKQILVLNELLEIPLNKFSPENVHALRVEIKKIRAIVSLLKYCKQNFKPKKHLKPFANLFKQAGKLRAIQVEQRLIKKYDLGFLNGSYLDSLRLAEEKQRNKFNKVVLSSNKNLIISEGQKLKSIIKTLSNKDIKDYQDKVTKKSKRMIRKNIFREDRLHSIRKELKEFYLNLKLLQPKNGVMKVIDQFLEKLGEWHDLQVACDHLTKVMSYSELTQNEISKLKEEKLKLILKREEILQTIVSSYLGKIHNLWKNHYFDTPPLV